MSDNPTPKPKRAPRKSRAKTPQVTPQVGPKLGMRDSQLIIEAHVRPANLKVKGAWGKEQKTLRQLWPLYPDVAFWHAIDFTFMLNSLLYFKSAEGAQELKRQWGLYQLTRPREAAPIQLDSEPNPATMGGESPVVPRQNAVDWASS